MKVSDLREQTLNTPCYVYDQQAIQGVLTEINNVSTSANIKPLYSIKAANNKKLLEFIQPYVKGFSCSSLNELKLADEILQNDQSLHITSPIYKQNEWDEIKGLANFISINSISQLQRLAQEHIDHVSVGIRINPELSFVKDSRYDPCRPDSKLGVTASQLSQAFDSNVISFENIDGIHVHNNCESSNFNEWRLTIEKVLDIVSALNLQLDWINLGGGYLFHDSEYDQLIDIAQLIRADHDIDIFIEPGKAVVGHSGYFIATVIDIITSGDGDIAILDGSINHLPEVFEYQYQPSVLNCNEEGMYQYKLAGCTCLSGDLFGEYSFAQALKIGDEIVFSHVGAYMQVKANWFNGVNQAATYLFDKNTQQFEIIMQYDYEDFRRR